MYYHQNLLKLVSSQSSFQHANKHIQPTIEQTHTHRSKQNVKANFDACYQQRLGKLLQQLYLFATTLAIPSRQTVRRLIFLGYYNQNLIELSHTYTHTHPHEHTHTQRSETEQPRLKPASGASSSKNMTAQETLLPA